MSHPKAVEYIKFYEHYRPSTSRAASPERGLPPVGGVGSIPFPRSNKPPGDIGYVASLYGKGLDLSPNKQHHLKYGMGLAGADFQRRHIFTELPGRTFNSTTWAAFSTQSAQLRKSMSPIKSRRQGGL